MFRILFYANLRNLSITIRKLLENKAHTEIFKILERE